MRVPHKIMVFHFFVGVVTECRLCLIQLTCFMVFLCGGLVVVFFQVVDTNISFSEFFFLNYVCNAEDKT